MAKPEIYSIITVLNVLYFQNVILDESDWDFKSGRGEIIITEAYPAEFTSQPSGQPLEVTSAQVTFRLRSPLT